MLRTVPATLVAVAAVAFCAVRATSSTPDLVRPLSESELAIRDAASNPDVNEREIELQKAIHEGLFESEEITQRYVFEYLWLNIRWIDLRPFSGILKEYDAKMNGHKGAWLLDINELLRKNRDERIAIYAIAIQSGEVILDNGRPWLRNQATRATAFEGLIELKNLAEFHFNSIPEGLQERFPLADFQSTLELCAGGDDQESAAALAANRLEKISDEDFANSMKSDPVFRRVVMRICDYVCAENPFTSDQNPGCLSAFRIYVRQFDYSITISGEEKAQIVRREQSATAESDSAGESWLARMGSLSLAGEMFESRMKIDD